MSAPVPAVTFDYGQTLAELDTVFLAARVAERGASVDVARLDAECPAAWDAYNDAKRRGEQGFEAWRSFMRTLLERAGARSTTTPDDEVATSLVDFLWSQQPVRNLWRRPIAGMEELVRDLKARGVRLGIVSNSEGKLRELLDEMGLGAYFPVVADSGKLGFEKPDRRIFDHVARGLGVETSDLVHVGDAWEADVLGALAVGARALWITADPAGKTLPPRVQACRSAADVRSALRAWGVPA
jgi:HAD superfamily hydrolase (TIGR01509 family)